MSYWQLLYHAVWATSEHRPFLVGDAERAIHLYVRERSLALGASLFALGGSADHLHIVVAIPPRLAVATFVGQIKSSASARYNREHRPDPRFAWQEEYGAYSIDRKRLPNLIDYVERQQQLHAQGHLIPTLERTHGDAPRLIGDSESAYYVDSRTWREEMMALDTDLFE